MGSICLTKHKNDDWFRSRRQIRGGFNSIPQRKGGRVRYGGDGGGG